MRSQFTVLASGSAGNASLLEINDFGVLLDAGLGPRQLATRLNDAGASWKTVRAAVLTHTHADHWRERTFAHLLWQRIPVYCHSDHVVHLRKSCPVFAQLEQGRLVRTYEAQKELRLATGLHCTPFEVPHDGGPTFGFRFENAGDLFTPRWTLAYAADLGTWDSHVASHLSDADILALEFNHDVPLQRSSGRPPRLIARVLGDEGHLSNAQAASLLEEVLRRSAPGRLRHVVQLHLSQECNRRELAVLAAREVLDGVGAEVTLHTASQHRPTIILFPDARGPVAATMRAIPSSVGTSIPLVG